MILHMLLATIAATIAPPAPPPRAAPVMVVPRGRLICRAEFGTASLVQRIRVCRSAADWRRLDARRRARLRQAARS